MRLIPPLAVFPVLLAAVMGTSNAHQDAVGIVKERMEAMKSIGRSMKNIGAMVRHKTPLDFAKIQQNAGVILRHGQRIPALFPKGSGDGVSEASPMIWRDRKGFEESAGQLTAAAQALGSAATAQEPKALTAAFKALGKTCGGCHKLFRIKKSKR